MTIRVLYSCPGCGLVKVSVDVLARRDDQNVVEWLEHTLAPALGRDHRRRSPTCHPESLADVMIPMTGADRVGGPAIQ